MCKIFFVAYIFGIKKIKLNSKMQATRWNKRRLIIIFVVLITSYTIFSSSYNKYQIDATIKNVKAEEVWDFISDFSKMKLLNPTM